MTAYKDRSREELLQEKELLEATKKDNTEALLLLGMVKD